MKRIMKLGILPFTFSVLTLITGCEPTIKTELLPVLTTSAVSEVTQTTATCGGIITADAGLSVTARGVCWGTTENPTITTSKTTDGVGVGTFSSSLVGLIAGTKYYVRSYATNSEGTAYGNSISFTTKPAIVYGSVSDIEGNTYKTITIGTQTWMAENLRTTKYRNGDLIGTTTTPNQNISTERDPRYQWAYNGDETKVSKYGRLYTWWAACIATITTTNAQGTTTTVHNIAPVGWHVASDADWTTLNSYLATSGIAYVAKSLSTTTDWQVITTLPEYTVGYVGNDLSKNNSTGFSALPCGIRDPSGSFNDLGSYTYWWTTTDYANKQAWINVIGYNYKSPDKFGRDYATGCSVRCVKD